MPNKTTEEILQIKSTPPESILSNSYRCLLSRDAVCVFTAIWYKCVFASSTTISITDDTLSSKSRVFPNRVPAALKELEAIGLLRTARLYKDTCQHELLDPGFNIYSNNKENLANV